MSDGRCNSTLLLLTLAMCALVTSGCMTRRTRLTEERSALLMERDQMMKPWQPQALRPKKNASTLEESNSPKERMQEIDQRVAELDEELLLLR